MTDNPCIISIKEIQEQINAGPDDHDGRVRLERFRSVCTSHQYLHLAVVELQQRLSATQKRLNDEQAFSALELADCRNADRCHCCGGRTQWYDVNKAPSGMAVWLRMKGNFVIKGMHLDSGLWFTVDKAARPSPIDPGDIMAWRPSENTVL